MPDDRPLSEYEVIVGVCGGISAYKVCQVVSRLVQDGAGVTVAMTAAAREFVRPLTFETLSGRQVFTDLWQANQYHDPQHIRLSETADLFLVAPATANTAAKMAAGIADDLISTMILSADCPVMLAPAMNTRMWANPIVKRNFQTLRSHGFLVVEPESGWLACRTVGPGRLADPQIICTAVAEQLLSRSPKAGRRGAQ